MTLSIKQGHCMAGSRMQQEKSCWKIIMIPYSVCVFEVGRQDVAAGRAFKGAFWIQRFSAPPEGDRHGRPGAQGYPGDFADRGREIDLLPVACHAHARDRRCHLTSDFADAGSGRQPL